MEDYIKTEIDKLFGRDAEDLFERLGKQTIPVKLQGMPKTSQAYILAGRQWLDERRGDICRTLSSSPIIRDFAAGRRAYDRVEMVGIVVDILSPYFSAPPLVTASVLVVKLGLNELCGESCFESPSGDDGKG